MTRRCDSCRETFPAEKIQLVRVPDGLANMCKACAKDKAITITCETVIWKART